MPLPAEPQGTLLNETARKSTVDKGFLGYYLLQVPENMMYGQDGLIKINSDRKYMKYKVHFKTTIDKALLIL